MTIGIAGRTLSPYLDINVETRLAQGSERSVKTSRLNISQLSSFEQHPKHS